ncbi:Hpt domain-containing protein, partial [Pseudoalteromonas sp. MMG005]|uniref:Hpt domain-containing protein n=1 Tax=Pseudoalteromonas sp. MMG005 TaxID=2822682 RepID=UPI001B3A0EBD
MKLCAFNNNFWYKQSLQHIATLYRTEQLDKIKEEAHFLKTSAKAIGAEICAHHLQTLEDSSLGQDKAICKLHIQCCGSIIPDTILGGIITT